MCKKVVLEWLKVQHIIKPNESYTINEIYKGLKLYGKPRCKETIWFQVVKLKELDILSATLSIPVKWRLKLPKK